MKYKIITNDDEIHDYESDIENELDLFDVLLDVEIIHLGDYLYTGEQIISVEPY